MKRPNVKSTMVEWILGYVAPHYCCSCGAIGTLLCESCKYDITSEPYASCLLCGQISPSSPCLKCRTDIAQTWCGGERSGGLETLINRYKFDYAKAAYVPLGDILLAALPELPSNTVVVPIPTIRTHVRQRGYDHTFQIAHYIAKERHLLLEQVLLRRTNTVQRGASQKVRKKQAEEAFVIKASLDATVPYLLIDDVVTTGSTLRSAATTMKEAGASMVWAAAVSRQPLD